MRLFLLVIMYSLILLIAAPAAADGFATVRLATYGWEGLFSGARLSALGSSDLADGSPAALLINPAPLATGNRVELGFDHANYLHDSEITTYAGSAEWNNWRLNIAIQEYTVDDVIIRTAYNPEGTGETFDIQDRMTLTGISYDLGRGLFDHPSLRWSAGAVWRRFSYTHQSQSTFSDTYDLGTTLGWVVRHQNGSVGITGAISRQNLKGKTIVFDDREAGLPELMRAGITMEAAFDWDGHQRNLVKLLVAYTHCHHRALSNSADSDHTGVEAVFFDTLALRWGNSTKLTGGISSWGVGLSLDGRLLGPFTVQADMGEMGYDNLASTDSETIWGLRVVYHY